MVDAAIVDGAASLTTMMHGMMAAGLWRDERGVNLLDTGVPWYDVYQTSNHQWMAVGALEGWAHRIRRGHPARLGEAVFVWSGAVVPS